MNVMNIKTKETNPFTVQKKAKLIEALSDLDNEILEKLVALKKSTKAIGMISSKQGWQTIQEFIM